MANKKTNNDVYSSIIAAIAYKSVEKVDGVKMLSADRKKQSRISSDVQVYIVKGEIKMDIFINVVFGCNIPETVCAVQEQVKADIEKETCFKVVQINVMVVSVLYSEADKPVVIEHVFDDDADDVAADDIAADEER